MLDAMVSYIASNTLELYRGRMMNERTTVSNLQYLSFVSDYHWFLPRYYSIVDAIDLRYLVRW
jgi:hypothetical protein